jgi:hypothetical protein
MPVGVRQQRLETKAIVIGYAMSRLDAGYLGARRCGTWRAAFAQAARGLGIPPASLKNLRDEFDPFHENARKGWHKRPLRPNRQRVLEELTEVTDEALLEMVARILAGDDEGTKEAIDSLAAVTRVVYNVAERLLTGRKAEDHFLANCERLIHVPANEIIDYRLAAMGFDFGVKGRPNQAIEVKGIKRTNGDIQFTDREWAEAKVRSVDYWLVVVGNLVATPVTRVIRDPHATVRATCDYRTTVAVVWRSRISVCA